jgi:diadenosine tetraphosphate (Ap4A) HIT family hydrolase
MSFHTDLAGWQAQADPRNCPVCQNEPMHEGMLEIELPGSWLVAEPVDCLRGACHLVAKKHVIELFDLEDAELLALMKEVQVCARALKTVTGAVKINYEIHGNTLAHLHVHLYPRCVDDPFPGQAIDYKKQRAWFEEGEFEGFMRNLRDEVERLAK